MNIEDLRYNTVALNKLDPGELFEHSNRIYILTNKTILNTPRLADSCLCEWCVNVSNGKVCTLNPCEIVKPLKGKLVIEGEK